MQDNSGHLGIVGDQSVDSPGRQLPYSSRIVDRPGQDAHAARMGNADQVDVDASVVRADRIGGEAECQELCFRVFVFVDQQGNSVGSTALMKEP